MGNGGKDDESAQLVSSSQKDEELGNSCGESKQKKSCGSKCVACLRCFFGFILFPFVLVLTFVAVLVFIILLPGTPFCFRGG